MQGQPVSLLLRFRLAMAALACQVRMQHIPHYQRTLARRTAGVMKRVAGLLVAGVVLGTVLFYVGLKLAFPDYT